MGGKQKAPQTLVGVHGADHLDLTIVARANCLRVSPRRYYALNLKPLDCLLAEALPSVFPPEAHVQNASGGSLTQGTPPKGR